MLVNLLDVGFDLVKRLGFEGVELPEVNHLKVRQMCLLFFLEEVDEELVRQHADKHHIEVEEGAHVFLFVDVVLLVVIIYSAGEPKGVQQGQYVTGNH